MNQLTLLPLFDLGMPPLRFKRVGQDKLHEPVQHRLDSIAEQPVCGCRLISALPGLFADFQPTPNVQPLVREVEELVDVCEVFLWTMCFAQQTQFVRVLLVSPHPEDQLHRHSKYNDLQEAKLQKKQDQ